MSIYGAYQDSIMGHTATQTTHHTESHRKLQSISDKMAVQTSTVNNKVKLGTTKATSVVGGESIPIADPDDRDGWLFQKLIVGDEKVNLYFYSEGNSACTLDELESIKSVVNIGNYQNFSSLPFIVVYTKLQASGNDGSWYHSKIVYTLSSNTDIILGETIEMYSGTKPDNINSHRQVAFNTKTIHGEALSTEEILTISVHTDSASALNTEVLFVSMGFVLNKNAVKITHNTTLVA